MGVEPTLTAWKADTSPRRSPLVWISRDIRVSVPLLLGPAAENGSGRRQSVSLSGLRRCPPLPQGFRRLPPFPLSSRSLLAYEAVWGFGGIPYGLDAPANLKISQYGRKKNQNRYAEHNEKGVHFLTVALEARAPTTRRLYTLAGRTALANYRVSLPNYEFFWGRDSTPAATRTNTDRFRAPCSI